jgi:cell division septum initiation protein DivIVA
MRPHPFDDVLDLVDETVAQITDAEVEVHLQRVLNQAGSGSHFPDRSPGQAGFVRNRVGDEGGTLPAELAKAHQEASEAVERARRTADEIVAAANRRAEQITGDAMARAVSVEQDVQEW